jgi:two-component system, sensor histidine kinase and response regulator
MTSAEPTPEAYSELVRKDPRIPWLVGLGVLCSALSLVPQLAFIAPALCVLISGLAGASSGQRAGIILSLYVTVLYVTASALGHGQLSTVVLTAITSLVAGAGLGRAAELKREIRYRAQRRSRTEAELKTRSEEHVTLLGAMPDVICRIDRAGTVLSGHGRVNEAAPNMSFRIGENVADILKGALGKAARESIQSVLLQGDPATFEFQIGRRHPREFEARVVRAGAHEALAIVRDITELKALQGKLGEAHRDALSAAGTKGRFLATMSHRIRTPMNGVIGMTNVLLQTRLSPEQREYTTIIRNSGEALLSILDDVLDYSRIEDGRMVLFRAPFALRDLLEELVELLAARAHNKGLEIASIIDARVPAWVQGDRGRLRQVIINLLGNAIKFTHHGHVVLRAAVVGHERDTALIRFDACDTGVGIPAEHQKNLFQDYAQAHPAISRQYGGTGLGLAISRQIVELMGGRMVVESSEGAGSTFSFTARFTTVQDRTTRSFLLPRSLSGAHILSMPLYPLTRELIEHQLSPLGAKVVVAEDHADYAARLRAHGPFDATLIELPIGTSEHVAAERVGEVAAIAGSMPIVALFSLGQRPVADQARQAGASVVLSRPLRRSSLYDGLVAVLGLTARPATSRAQPGKEESTASSLRARVLVAEDNLVNQKVAVRTLELLGCHAEVAENGALALEALAQREFDAVLMDCQMPVLDGFDATRQIRELERAGKPRTPIIAVTANAMEGDRERCLSAGMDDYLAKPVTMAALDEALRKWLPENVKYRRRSEPPEPSDGRGSAREPK